MGGVGLELGGETITLLTPQLQGVALAVTRGGLDSAQGPGGGARGGARGGVGSTYIQCRYHKTGNQDYAVCVTFICQAISHALQ